MKVNSSDENKSSKKIKNRKKSSNLSEEENEDERENSNKKPEEEININKSQKQLELQKKLKFIFNEVREKGKYEYNKQEIPEHLKYHSDSDSSEQSKITKKGINNTSQNTKKLNNKNSEKKSIN